MHSNDVLDNAVKEFFITVKRKDGERYKSKSLHTLNPTPPRPAPSRAVQPGLLRIAPRRLTLLATPTLM
ncbi:hypothetical protein FJT64_026838 [Amphibalanus amphitrite]|uniref:Uncharacterized protein n=1 Tax=Amphibalanus amphitrite TaxID=1232801 RepID=A0A6A4WAM6_AMPAM|nr:hypothetical protein FJT64_026838 [Amphibalanus amphitrite]